MHHGSIWEVDIWLHIFLILALDEGGVSYRPPPVAKPPKEGPWCHWTGSWVGSRDSV